MLLTSSIFLVFSIPFIWRLHCKSKERPSAFLGYGIVASIPTTPFARAFPWRKTRAG